MAVIYRSLLYGRAVRFLVGGGGAEMED